MNDITAVASGTSIVRVTWSAPSPVAVPLTSYQLETGRPGISTGRSLQTFSSTTRLRFVSGLSPGTFYEFIVRGLFSGGVVGEDRVATVTTLETGETSSNNGLCIETIECCIA